MAAFDPAQEMKQIERMDEADVKKELAAAREDTSGTRRRLNERLHARRCKDAAEATAADEGAAPPRSAPTARMPSLPCTPPLPCLRPCRPPPGRIVEPCTSLVRVPRVWDHASLPPSGA